MLLNILPSTNTYAALCIPFLYSHHTRLLAPLFSISISLPAGSQVKGQSWQEKQAVPCQEGGVRWGGAFSWQEEDFGETPFTFTVASPHLGISWVSLQIKWRNTKKYLTRSLQNRGKTKISFPVIVYGLHQKPQLRSGSPVSLALRKRQFMHHTLHNLQRRDKQQVNAPLIPFYRWHKAKEWLAEVNSPRDWMQLSRLSAQLLNHTFSPRSEPSWQNKGIYASKSNPVLAGRWTIESLKVLSYHSSGRKITFPL